MSRRSMALVVSSWAACATPSTDPPVDTVDVPPVCVEEAVTGRHVLRLTATTYDRVVEDLVGRDLELSEAFPPDGGGWEDRFEAQAISPALVEAWQDAAHDAAEELLARGVRTTRSRLADAGLTVGEPVDVATSDDPTWWAVDVAGDVTVGPITLSIPRAGTWRLSLRAAWFAGWEVAPDAEPDLISLRVDGRTSTAPAPLEARFEAPAALAWDLPLTAGDHDVVVHIAHRAPGVWYRLIFDDLVADGPVDDPFGDDSAARRRWVACDTAGPDGAACVRSTLEAFAQVAWRGDVPSAALDRLVALVQLAVDEGDDVEVGLRLAVRAVLGSPRFLLRAEDVAGLAQGEVRAASPLELANRLSFLLWRSLPDAALSACAAAGTLTAAAPPSEPCSLSAQVARMLDHPRADAVVADFSRQWLGLDEVDGLDHDATLFPELDADLRTSMRAETEALIDDFRVRDLPLPGLLDSATSFVDARLAALYDLPAPGGDGLVAVTVPAARAGLLGHASVLATTSRPDRTSPVLRGQWILARLLCDPPEPPPAQIPALDPEEAAHGDLRALLEAHRRDPACSGCHDSMDGLGLVLESRDALGRVRTTYDDGTAVDTSGHLPDGTPVADPAALAHLLAADPAVAACIADQLTAWALERAPTPADACEVDAVAQAVARDGLTFRAVLGAVATSSAMTQVASPDPTDPSDRSEGGE